MKRKQHDEDDRTYGDADSWLRENRDAVERGIVEIYRSNEGLACRSCSGIDASDLEALLKMAFNAGLHSGASNPYC